MKTLTVRIGYPFRSWQKSCAKLTERFVVLAIHRRAGKTEISLQKLLDEAVKNKLDLPLYFYVAPYLKQAKIIAWVRLKQMVESLVVRGLVTVSEADLAIKFTHNKAIVRIFGADNPDAMRGVRLDGAILDEVAQMKGEVWEEIIQPALSDRLGWAWFIGTPKGINLFSSLFSKAARLKNWARKRFTVYDTDALDPEEIERLRNEMSEQSFAREMLCDFDASADDQLISLTTVEVATQKYYKPGEMDYAAKVLGVDVARYGNDRSVIFPRQGMQALTPESYRGLDNMDFASRVARKIDAWEPDAVFIDEGAGSGVIDRLRQLGYVVIGVHFGGKANDPKYINKRTEMWFLAAEWLESGGSIPRREGLQQELAAPSYWYDKKNKICLESKDDIKLKLEGDSPDEADGLVLTFAQPVAKDNLKSVRHLINPNKKKEYDPYASI